MTETSSTNNLGIKKGDKVAFVYGRAPVNEKLGTRTAPVVVVCSNKVRVQIGREKYTVYNYEISAINGEKVEREKTPKEQTSE